MLGASRGARLPSMSARASGCGILEEEVQFAAS